MLGILLINKPIGITSHDVVDLVRRSFGTRRVGHAGTLDPLATGALVIAVGPATRFLQYLPLEPKEYLAEVTFGQSSNTQDAEGILSESAAIPPDLRSAIESQIGQFLGPITQIPPMYSAVKKAGKALFHYARKGEEVARDPRPVFVDEFAITAVEPPVAKFRIVCSGGTYVRTLANDLGEKMGCGAYLSALHRTRVGKFLVQDAISVDEMSLERLIPLAKALEPMYQVTLNTAEVADIVEGRTIFRDVPKGLRLVTLLTPEARALSVASVNGNALHPECVILSEAMTSAL